MRFTVTIDEVGTNGKRYALRVNVPSAQEALKRALTQQWGAGCIWQTDSGLKGFGQVFKSMRALGYQSDQSFTSRTTRARLTITEGWNI